MNPKLESRALKYGFSNARVKAMKGLLLSQAALDELIKVSTIDAMVELLQRTDYRSDLLAKSIDYSNSELIELAAGSNFVRMVTKLKSFTPKSDIPAVKALLRKWDLLNLKTIVNAKQLGKTYSEIKPFVFPAGDLSEKDFEEIANAEPEAIFNEIRKTQLGSEMLSTSTALFSKHMWDTFRNALKNLNTFRQVETILDAYTYLFMDKALSEVAGPDADHIRRILKKEIDAKNILIIERLKKRDYSPEKISNYLIRGGTMSRNFIRSIIEAKDLGQAIQIAKSKFRRLHLKEGEITLSDLEIALEKALAAEKTLAFHRSVLSVGVILGFLLLKEEEINNLRKIAKGKEYGIPENEIREMLVIV
jgi:V/A-type H+-transporting ATPase subunit C